MKQLILAALLAWPASAIAQAPLFTLPTEPPSPATDDQKAAPEKPSTTTTSFENADQGHAAADDQTAPLQNAAPRSSDDVGPRLQQLEDRLMNAEGKVDGLAEQQTEARGILDQLTKIKLSGYIQGRFEYHGDSADGLNAQNRPMQTTGFLVRRGRLKAVYTGQYAEFLLQIDAASSGVTLKDAEATLIEPWSGDNIRFTVGQFKWPFGYEVLQSSSMREMPERSLVMRRLFPGERDRGIRLQWNHDLFRSSIALVNGNGTQDTLFGAFDQNGWKDVVGRLGLDLGELVFGVSGYFGKGVRATAGNPGAVPPTQPTYAEYDKTRIGSDIQAYFDIPSLGGLALKGEFVYGEELFANVLGWYFLAVQNVGDQLGIFTRVDHYDPDIEKSDNATIAVAGGVQYFFSGNIKASAVYEHPMTELRDPADDIFTFQLQAMY